MSKLNIKVLIDCLRSTQHHLYDLYVYTLDIPMADALLHESNRLGEIIRQLKQISGNP